MSSSAKDTTQASQTAPSQPTQPGTGEQNKQPASSTPQVEASAVTTNTQAPTPAPAATNSDTEPDPEKAQLAAADAAAAPPAGPVEYAPGTLEDQDRDERRRRHQAKLLIVHTRIAKFVSWLLLLGFVILPGTFKDNGAKNISLLPIGYVCCFFNFTVVAWLWNIRKKEHDWLFDNLFFSGLTNAFSGLLSAFVSVFGSHGGHFGTASKTTVALASVSTIVYGVLSFFYFRKRLEAKRRRGSTYSRGSVP